MVHNLDTNDPDAEESYPCNHGIIGECSMCERVKRFDKGHPVVEPEHDHEFTERGQGVGPLLDREPDQPMCERVKRFDKGRRSVVEPEQPMESSTPTEDVSRDSSEQPDRVYLDAEVFDTSQERTTNLAPCGEYGHAKRGRCSQCGAMNTTADPETWRGRAYRCGQADERARIRRIVEALPVTHNTDGSSVDYEALIAAIDGDNDA